MLQGWQVGILRPPHQAHTLADMVHQLQGEPILIPLYDIEPIKIDDETISHWSAIIANADFIIVSSKNAVLYAPKQLFNQQSKAFIVTMGESTTQALLEVQQNQEIGYTAPAGSTSESVLSEPFFNTSMMHEKRVVLLAGEGGRTVFSEVLHARGALITWMKVYRMRQNIFDLSKYFLNWQNATHFCFVATSSRILEGIFKMTPARDMAWLITRPLIVVSDRAQLQAKEMGFKQIFIAPSPHSDGIESALQKMVAVYTPAA
ncbi:MAG: uroporphyrinogen-III synthase [Proteobacteria bacterium]|nr:uroporphyrinogen-III synthase [Pseudomonadota bacterium]